jgi:hypothetical protein
MDLGFPDHIADPAVDEHDFKHRNEHTVDGRDQLLRDHSLQHHGKLDPYLLLLGWGEYVDDPVDRIRCAQGMKGRKNQLAGFRS